MTKKQTKKRVTYNISEPVLDRFEKAIKSGMYSKSAIIEHAIVLWLDSVDG